MDINTINKLLLFWVIFYITPGPVWIAVMETTRNLSTIQMLRFFIRAFLPVNLTIQVAQTVVCILFIDWVSKIFADMGLWLYIFGGLYILYLAYKVISSKAKNTHLNLSFANLAMVMLLSPKIWLLFPSGALIAIQLQQETFINVLVFAVSMLLVSNLMFFVYVLIGKMGTKLLKDNFAYLSFMLLILFALFLFNEAVNLIVSL